MAASSTIALITEENAIGRRKQQKMLCLLKKMLQNNWCLDGIMLKAFLLAVSSKIHSCSRELM